LQYFVCAGHAGADKTPSSRAYHRCMPGQMSIWLICVNVSSWDGGNENIRSNGDAKTYCLSGAMPSRVFFMAVPVGSIGPSVQLVLILPVHLPCASQSHLPVLIFPQPQPSFCACILTGAVVSCRLG